MGVQFIKDRDIFHLYTENYSYYIHINKFKYLIHLYDGKFMSDISKERTSERYMERYAFLNDEYKENQDEDYYFSMIASRFECASYGKADKRNPHTIIEDETGVDITNFLYVSHEIFDGIDESYSLPHFKFRKKDAQTLKITLKDEIREVYLDLFYIIAPKYDSLVRYSRITNKTGKKLFVEKLSSMELDLNSMDYEILAMKGTWGNDRELEKIQLNHSLTKISDNHGARGFYYNPSLALIKKDTTFDNGEAYGLSYVYSGDFSFEFKVDEIDQTRIVVGFNEENFRYCLENEESLTTPLTLQTFTEKGINDLTHKLHDIIRDKLLPEKWAFEERPILLNSWEAMYFDFNTDKIIEFIDKSKEANMEMVVLDDGWFLKRNDDTSSLGDWVVDTSKIDLHKVIDYTHSLGLKFGLWVEPEMISPNSDLFKNHPEYALYSKSIKNPTLLRHQLVLDLVNKKARDNVFDQICKIFDEYKVDYVKWDFNRYLSEAYSEILKSDNKKETYHRFVLGSYDLFERFTKRYPDILLESCSSGGGRFDLGMLYFSPQIWGSDETDLVSRNSIQFATNIFYPLSTIGSHVSSRKQGSIQDKACLAFFGTYGYEMDITKSSEEDINKMKEFNGLKNQYHHVVTKGDYYAIFNPMDSNYCAFNVVSKDKKQCLVYFFIYRKEQTKSRYIKIKGLEKYKYYYNSLTNEIYTGDFYMNLGLNISCPLDSFTTMFFVLQEVDAIKASIYRKTKQKDGGKRDKIL